MNREALEKSVEAFYEARLANDPAACVNTFGDAPGFGLPGLPGDKGRHCRIEDRDELEAIIRSLVDLWQWQEIRDRVVMIDGFQAAVRYTLVTLFGPTGETITTEMMDHLIFDENGMATSFTQFLDTALVRRLTGTL